jgi:uncharacterized protein (DUF1501 family)
MPTTRRQFIKRGASAISMSLLLPRFLNAAAFGQQAAAAADRRILVVIQLSGGVDGLNTLVPYSDPRYSSLRPALSFQESELKDSQGQSTVLDADFGLHPAMSGIKQLYDSGKTAIVRGVGYQNSSLSHFLGSDIWATANTNGGGGNGWLGRYADQVLFGSSGLQAVALGGALPKALFADKVVIPSISSFSTYTYQTDPRNNGDRNNQINTFNSTNHRTDSLDTFLGALADTSVDAVNGAAQVQEAIATYSSPVTYPTGTPANQLAPFLQMAAQLITTIPEANVLYVQMGGFDTHSGQIGDQNDPANKLVGDHGQRIGWFSDAVKSFYDDIAAHGLAEKTLMITWSEFGRRPNENASFGTDHGTASPLFVIGDPVISGLYGDQPSLAPLDLDGAGNMKPTVDFRSVYATVLDSWLGADSKSILGDTYSNLGFIK